MELEKAVSAWTFLMSNSQSTRTQLYWNTLVRIPSQLASFAISIIVARILMPKDFGIFGIVMILVGYANMFTDLGFTQAIVQKQIKNKNTLDSIFTLNLAVSLLLTIFFYLFAGHIAIFFETPECKKAVQVMSLVFIVSSFSGVPHGILRRDVNFITFSLIEMSYTILMSAVTLTLALCGFKYWALLYGQLIPMAVIAIVLCIKAKWYPSIYYNHSLMKGIYNFGVWNFLTSQLSFLSRTMDKLIIGRCLGAVSLGFYDKSKSISLFPAEKILMNINAVMFSSFSKNKGSKNEIQDQLKKSLAITAIIIYPMYTGLILVAPYFVYGLLGEKWNPMIFPFQIILFGFFFKSFGGITASFNVAVGKYKSRSLRLLVSVFIFIVACFGLLRFGLNGIAISFVIFCFSSFILDTSLAISQAGFSCLDFSKVLLSGILPTAIMGLSVHITSYCFLCEYNVLNLILLSSLGGVVYSICLFLDPVKSSRVVREILIGDIKKRLFFLYRH